MLPLLCDFTEVVAVDHLFIVRHDGNKPILNFDVAESFAKDEGLAKHKRGDLTQASGLIIVAKTAKVAGVEPFDNQFKGGRAAVSEFDKGCFGSNLNHILEHHWKLVPDYCLAEMVLLFANLYRNSLVTLLAVVG